MPGDIVEITVLEDPNLNRRVLVGPDGVIQWRADYGGPPNFTMYVPGSQLLDDLRAARQAG